LDAELPWASCFCALKASQLADLHHAPDGNRVDGDSLALWRQRHGGRPGQAITRVATINTIAGDGTAGYLGDSGPATSAELNSPYGLAIDNAGNLYIADPANNRVRKVVLGTGIISTFAGNGAAGYSGDNGPATSAEL
jgi:hypothetical protein